MTTEQASELGPEACKLTWGHTSGLHRTTFLFVLLLNMDTDQMSFFFLVGGGDNCFVLYRILTFDLYPLDTNSILFPTPAHLW